MQLVHIKYTKCPSCGAKIRQQTQESQHCNGHWNEIMKFECGHELHFIPNFMQVREKHPCVRTPEFKARIEAEQALHDKLVDTINKFGAKTSITDEYRKKLLRDIEYSKPSRWY